MPYPLTSAACGAGTCSRRARCRAGNRPPGPMLLGPSYGSMESGTR